MDPLLSELLTRGVLEREQWRELLSRRHQLDRAALFALAREIRARWFGNRVYIRGLIECTNYCKNNCLYCGIRRGNSHVQRYRLTQAEILACCEQGYRWGFRTFVLQGGEDPRLTPDWVAQVVREITRRFPDCAVTLSLGEWEREVYRLWYEAGARRYLLRHETADPAHYARLHPPAQTLSRRIACLYDLKALGYQVGAGFMVGSPGQSDDTLAQDFCFLQDLQPEMVGIGPFLPQHDTPFAQEPPGTLEDTLLLLALLRLTLPAVLLPATTALATLHPRGRVLGMEAGANVVMPNLSPPAVRESYALYDGKAATGVEAAEHLADLRAQLAPLGLTVAIDRGDAPTKRPQQS
ncbi:MAG TPA: [FeFe] hydrogenase H-cluster radical SAM maturase HydE [Candidatus Avoscillospira avicola]|uniref:[FeFe] hydrogenase H-cluster radical SAM maturase HydE n=1 Tax=Candidatus Avoscillospira avicola TaxID=2840706 RepID=A0A9D1DHC2_9FIRM|nr:[FeFe] hydrogenase H-cluster radical SAM maturase HydE [Candidatus Avoscillospira avicola]